MFPDQRKTGPPGKPRTYMEWLKDNLWNVFFSAMLLAIATGSWTEKISSTKEVTTDLSRRVSFLEDRYATEMTRLNAYFMTKELASQQYDDILRQLSEIKQELVAQRPPHPR